MNAQIANSQDTVSNSLGKLVKHCVAHGVQIGLATATYQRGDMRHIIPDKLRDEKFRQARIDYENYFNERAPVESFDFQIVCGDTQAALGKILRRHAPTILYLANATAAMRPAASTPKSRRSSGSFPSCTTSRYSTTRTRRPAQNSFASGTFASWTW